MVNLGHHFRFQYVFRVEGELMNISFLEYGKWYFETGDTFYILLDCHTPFFIGKPSIIYTLQNKIWRQITPLNAEAKIKPISGNRCLGPSKKRGHKHIRILPLLYIYIYIYRLDILWKRVHETIVNYGTEKMIR